MSPPDSIHRTEKPNAGVPILRTDSFLDDDRVKLTWRSWFIVFVSCFAIFSQVFVVVAAGSVIAFIIRDLGEPAIAGWIIQGPLLMQSVLSPITGRLSDVLDRKYLAGVPPLIAFAGAVISAKAESMATLIGGGVLIGTTLSTISIVQAIPSEILPLKYRALANGFAFLAGSFGGLVGVLGSGGVTNINPSGWRNIFWMQAAFHGMTALGLLGFYWPPPSNYPRLSWRQLVWACDPIGSLLMTAGTTLLLLGFDWAGGTFPWRDAHVLGPLVSGAVLLILFGLYEWKGRTDGIVAHVFFSRGPNFGLSVFAFAVEGFIFYSAVNSVVPQIVLNLGFETNAWRISVRQLAYNLVIIVSSVPVTWYATRYKDLKNPLLVTFFFFLVVSICYATITPKLNHAQIGYNVISGIGQSGPLTLIVALTQFTAPHQFLSTATGLAFSARAIGGAFGSAILDAIINNKLASYDATVGAAAVSAGLPADSVPALLAALAGGGAASAVPGVTDAILAAATTASRNAYARAYRFAWAPIIPFVVVAMVCIACLKDVSELMTEHVEATVEHVPAARVGHGERDEEKATTSTSGN
ncbi:major facilitator superfamily domain-containing protein [Mycena albidolilacea]|uniref:Major facilitator superfamily domain-containing protein n=1 Tax=Mycena albidolilacea TaxID=1033008 RepID=A0AAD7A434_9AGAR|nr:major facilitator superfamily domain-containing protein [Mycena albidolilacea]